MTDHRSFAIRITVPGGEEHQFDGELVTVVAVRGDGDRASAHIFSAGQIELVPVMIQALEQTTDRSKRELARFVTSLLVSNAETSAKPRRQRVPKVVREAESLLRRMSNQDSDTSPN